jgi:hypothetical protein
VDVQNLRGKDKMCDQCNDDFPCLDNFEFNDYHSINAKVKKPKN